MTKKEHLDKSRRTPDDAYPCCKCDRSISSHRMDLVNKGIKERGSEERRSIVGMLPQPKLKNIISVVFETSPSG